MQLEVCYSRKLSERIGLTHRGPQAPLFAAPPLAARVRRSLHRGGQGLWTLWTLWTASMLVHRSAKWEAMVCYQVQRSGWLQCNHPSVQVALRNSQILDDPCGFGSGAPCASPSPVTGRTSYWEVRAFNSPLPAHWGPQAPLRAAMPFK